VQILRHDADLGGSALGDFHRGAAQRPADLALELAHPSFARVVADDRVQRLSLISLLAVRPLAASCRPTR